MSILSEYHNDTVRAMHADEGMLPFDEQAALDYDHANELAIALITASGLTVDSTDDLHDDITDDVQTLLILAFARSGVLREFVEEIVSKI